MAHVIVEDFKKYCIEQHDIECNQKYGDNKLPYSFHLNLVSVQARKWSYLLGSLGEQHLTEMGAWGHDLIEDARNTYNDVLRIAGLGVAQIVYCCTDEKGRNRDERHNAKFYIELAANRLAVFVKLCDIIANITYSLLTNSSMYKKYSTEYPKMKKYLYREEFKPMFDHIEKLIEL